MHTPISDNPHTFHIPVLGTGFTIDTPLKVGRYGISSVMSLVDDVLVEQMRRHHCHEAGEPYEPIKDNAEDARARRITAWLNLVDRLVRRQVEELAQLPFEPDSDITRYFEMLPDSPLRSEYERMLQTKDAGERSLLESALRAQVRPGSSDVNIMTKLDGATFRRRKMLPPEFNTAMSALRGYAESTLESSIVFSAGMNPRLYSYAAQFPDFQPGPDGESRKKIIIKVSDFRSAVIQGKFLAKRGLWVSEFRIESGLNCGGHAFATAGLLMGPILAEFREKKEALILDLHESYAKTLASRDLHVPDAPRVMRVTAQGGIGTAVEHRMLLDRYGVDSCGWGTPFLLVPEATLVDDGTLEKLVAAQAENVFLSGSSPLGVPFWNLNTSASEERRRHRIEKGRPGSPCTKGYLATNVEFSELPICTASRAYQHAKLDSLLVSDMEESRREEELRSVIGKSCICHDLGGGAMIRLGIHTRATPAVCCGPNIVNFNRISTLREMIDHIYGRRLFEMNQDRPHMFVREVMLYLDHLRDAVRIAPDGGGTDALVEFRDNLLAGIEYYLMRPELFGNGSGRVFDAMSSLRSVALEAIALIPPVPAPSGLAPVRSARQPEGR